MCGVLKVSLATLVEVYTGTPDLPSAWASVATCYWGRQTASKATHVVPPPSDVVHPRTGPQTETPKFPNEKITKIGRADKNI